MKTEQEQIKAIKQIIDERVETNLGQVQGRHGNVIKTVDTIIIARDIVEAGYGEVSEYKAEIERLKDEIIYLERKIAIRDNALKDRDKAIEMLEGKQDTIVKQAQIDVLNKTKKCSYCDNDFMDGKWHRYVFVDDIDKLIEEVQNGEDKG